MFYAINDYKINQVLKLIIGFDKIYPGMTVAEIKSILEDPSKYKDKLVKDQDDFINRIISSLKEDEKENLNQIYSLSPELIQSLESIELPDKNNIINVLIQYELIDKEIRDSPNDKFKLIDGHLNSHSAISRIFASKNFLEDIVFLSETIEKKKLVIISSFRYWTRSSFQLNDETIKIILSGSEEEIAKALAETQNTAIEELMNFLNNCTAVYELTNLGNKFSFLNTYSVYEFTIRLKQKLEGSEKFSKEEIYNILIEHQVIFPAKTQNSSPVVQTESEPVAPVVPIDSSKTSSGPTHFSKFKYIYLSAGFLLALVGSGAFLFRNKILDEDRTEL